MHVVQKQRYLSYEYWNTIYEANIMETGICEGL